MWVKGVSGLGISTEVQEVQKMGGLELWEGEAGVENWPNRLQ